MNPEDDGTLDLTRLPASRLEPGQYEGESAVAYATRLTDMGCLLSTRVARELIAEIGRLRVRDTEAERIRQGHLWREQEQRRLMDEIERLRAIVDKLPKTKDGVQVVPGVDWVWTWQAMDGGYWWRERASTAKHIVGVSYSTREAAEADGGKG